MNVSTGHSIADYNVAIGTADSNSDIKPTSEGELLTWGPALKCPKGVMDGRILLSLGALADKGIATLLTDNMAYGIAMNALFLHDVISEGFRCGLMKQIGTRRKEWVYVLKDARAINQLLDWNKVVGALRSLVWY